MCKSLVVVVVVLQEALHYFLSFGLSTVSGFSVMPS